MAMFDKHKSSKQAPPAADESRVKTEAPMMSAASTASVSKVAMIGQGISVSGDVNADSNLKIEGRIEGRNVQCAGEIEIGESGHVLANIVAKTVTISGEVSGDIGGSEKVLITKSGKVQGNIIAPRVQLEDGALFRGSIDMSPVQSAGADKSAQVKKAAASRPAAPENVKQSAVASSAPSSSAVGSTARKEPGLNLKSG